MNSKDAIRQTVLDELLSIAPEADLASIDPQASLRAQLDLDSFDFLHLLIALQQALDVDVPEADYGRIDSLSGLIDYLQARRRRSSLA